MLPNKPFEVFICITILLNLKDEIIGFFAYYPCRMHRKNGQFASSKESSGPSHWDSSQSGLQDGSPRPETV